MMGDETGKKRRLEYTTRSGRAITQEKILDGYSDSSVSEDNIDRYRRSSRRHYEYPTRRSNRSRSENKALRHSERVGPPRRYIDDSDEGDSNRPTETQANTSKRVKHEVETDTVPQPQVEIPTKTPVIKLNFSSPEKVEKEEEKEELNDEKVEVEKEEPREEVETDDEELSNNDRDDDEDFTSFPDDNIESLTASEDDSQEFFDDEEEDEDLRVSRRSLRNNRRSQPSTRESRAQRRRIIDSDDEIPHFNDQVRKKERVDYSKFYMPAAANNVMAGEKRRKADERASHIGYRPGKWRRDRGKNQAYGSDEDEDMNRRSRFNGASGLGRIGNIAGISAPQGSGVDLGPFNLNELLRAQEETLLKDLSEPERKKYEENTKTYRSNGGKELADTDPVAVEKVDFESIGGLKEHIRTLKEMVVMPLLYPEIFENFKINPPRGVLFHGPPGTGKTMMARALAYNCSTSTQKVAFFMRKGADILSKWVGESERQLRLLFEQAKAWQPSIIFFDELDGLAPVRSSKQDQIHSSIVSTLLALMDGLDSRGQIVVIGATNRIDAIDPALRRPGRFDREFYFPLPSQDARKKIMEICTKDWCPPLSEDVLEDLSKETRGYCGADVKALCTEAALCSVRRTFPEIYDSPERLLIDMKCVAVTKNDFMASMSSIIPSTQRTSTIHSYPLPSHVEPLLADYVSNIISFLELLYPILEMKKNQARVSNDASSKSLFTASLLDASRAYFTPIEPRILICGPANMGQKYIGACILDKFESKKFYVQSLDLASLVSESVRTPEAALVQYFHELKRHSPAAVYIPNVDVWFDTLGETAQSVFLALLKNLHSDNQFICLASCECEVIHLNESLQEIFGYRVNGGETDEAFGKKIVQLSSPGEGKRALFFKSLMDEVKQGPPKQFKIKDSNEPISTIVAARVFPKAPPPPARELGALEKAAIKEHDEAILRQLRMELRTITKELSKIRDFRDFCRPVARDLFPDYYEQIECPMDLLTISLKINQNEYSTAQEWAEDIDLIVDNTSAYNDSDSAIVDKAMHMRDRAFTMLEFLSPDFVWECKQVALRRKAAQIKYGIEDTNPIKKLIVRTASPSPSTDADDAKERKDPKNFEEILSDNNEMDIDVDEVDQQLNLNGVKCKIDVVEKEVNEVVTKDSEENSCTKDEIANGIIPPHSEPTHVHPLLKDNPKINVETNLRKELFDSDSELSDQLGECPDKGGQPAIQEDDTQLNCAALPSIDVDMGIDNETVAIPQPVLPIMEEIIVNVIVDEEQITEFVTYLCEITSGFNVSEMEELGIILAGVLCKFNKEADRRVIINEMKSVIPAAVSSIGRS